MPNETVHPDVQMKPGDNEAFNIFLGTLVRWRAGSLADIRWHCRIPEDIPCRIVPYGSDLVHVYVRSCDECTVDLYREGCYVVHKKVERSWWDLWDLLVNLIIMPVIIGLVGGAIVGLACKVINSAASISLNGTSGFYWGFGIITVLAFLFGLIGTIGHKLSEK